jgi:hypothetical protein
VPRVCEFYPGICLTTEKKHGKISVMVRQKPQFNSLNAELNTICHLLILLGGLTFMGLCFVSISNKTQCYTVYLYLETALHVSGGISTHHRERINCITASGICHTVTAICRYRGRVGTGLSVLWVAYATHSTLKPAGPTMNTARLSPR